MILGTILLIGSSYNEDVETIARSILYCMSVAVGNDANAAVVASSMAVVREVGLVE